MSVAGKWRVTMPTPIGTMQFVWDITNDAGVWRGQMTGDAPVGDSELTGIEVNGNAIGFLTTVQSPMGTLQLTFKGAAANGKMTGTCTTRFGDNQFSAMRA
jgi:hypothetical protein